MRRASRRAVIRALGATAATVALRLNGDRVLAADEPPAQSTYDFMRPEADRLRRLARRLATIPRRRNFKALPMILLQPDQ